jgi:predicted transcriptional regulator
MPMAHLSPNHAKRIAAYARGLKELRLLTPHDFAVLDAMLWTLREPGHAELEPKYADIARKAGVKRDAAINAVRKLVQFGLLTKAKQWVIVQWGRGRFQKEARQRPNLYVFTTFPLESAVPSASTEVDILVSRVERRVMREQADTPLERALAALAGRAGFTVTP